MVWNWARKAYETIKSWMPDRHALLLLGAMGIGGEGCTMMTEEGEDEPEDRIEEVILRTGKTNLEGKVFFEDNSQPEGVTLKVIDQDSGNGIPNINIFYYDGIGVEAFLGLDPNRRYLPGRSIAEHNSPRWMTMVRIDWGLHFAYASRQNDEERGRREIEAYRKMNRELVESLKYVGSMEHGRYTQLQESNERVFGGILDFFFGQFLGFISFDLGNYQVTGAEIADSFDISATKLLKLSAEYASWATDPELFEAMEKLKNEPPQYWDFYRVIEKERVGRGNISVMGGHGDDLGPWVGHRSVMVPSNPPELTIDSLVVDGDKVTVLWTGRDTTNYSEVFLQAYGPILDPTVTHPGQLEYIWTILQGDRVIKGNEGNPMKTMHPLVSERLGDGEYTLQIRTRDQTGNTSMVTQTFRIGSQSQPAIATSFCGVYGFKGIVEELVGHCQQSLRGQERDLEFIINVEDGKITARDNFGVEYTGRIDQGNARFEAAEQSIEVGPNCNVVFQASFSGRLTQEVLEGTWVGSLSELRGAGCGGFVYENVDCQQTIVGQGTKKENLPECTIPEETPPPPPPQCIDNDRDGYGENCRRPDCDDRNPTVNPSMDDMCNGVDDDCDGIIDGNCPRIRYVVRTNNEPQEIVTADSGTGAILSRFSLAPHRPRFTYRIGKKSPTRNELILSAGIESIIGIRLVNSETGDTLREYQDFSVIRGAVHVSQAVWLPDGNTIAVFIVNPADVDLIDRETGQVTNLGLERRGQQLRAEDRIGMCPVVGRTELAFVRRNYGPNGVGEYYLATVDYTNGRVIERWRIPDDEYLNEYNALACSPRLNQYALQVKGRLLTLREEGNGLVPIGFGSYQNETDDRLMPVFAPDGKSIAISDINNGNRDIFLLDRLDSDQVRVRQLTNTPNQDETNPDFTQ